MSILLIDTSGPEAWVALVKDGEILSEHTWLADRLLAVTLLEKIDDLLEECRISVSDLKKIAVVSGPGHWSGLRTGIVVASVLAGAAGSKLVDLGLPRRKDELIGAVGGAESVDAVLVRYT
ncbi:MAG: tRNA (adenosine(37)-N6)-threonylcarbamoyltransferase complex dimerization subunit type 1 TsaB [bacterium]|nr:tRNA (adenosine(37)-N6)-threonylcarbamoyltransferase complex dimerization subunit type 1 TsaB [bacterium]